MQGLQVFYNVSGTLHILSIRYMYMVKMSSILTGITVYVRRTNRKIPIFEVNINGTCSTTTVDGEL